jgi:hypothetical protein
LSDQLYIRLGLTVRGPYSLADLHELAGRGTFSKAHEVSTDRKSWTSAASRPELFPVARRQQSVDARKTSTTESEISDRTSGPQYSHATHEHASASMTDTATRQTRSAVAARELSAQAVLVAVAGPVGFFLLLACTAMIVMRLRSSNFIASQNIGLIILLSIDFVLGCVAATLGYFAIRRFQQHAGTVRERNLIVIGLSCGCTILILNVLYSVVLLISALG